MPASPPQMPALGFVGLGQYLDANRGALSDQFGQVKKKADDTIASGDQGAEMDLGRSLGSENALAGKYGAPGNGGAGFDAALSWGAYGPQYKTLSEHLDQAAHAQPVVQAAPQVDPAPQTPTPDSPAAPTDQGGPGAGEGTGGSTFTPTPSSDNGPGISGLRRALRQVGR